MVRSERMEIMALSVYSYDGQIRLKDGKVAYRLSIEEARDLMEQLALEIMDTEIEKTLKEHEDFLAIQEKVA